MEAPATPDAAPPATPLETPPPAAPAAPAEPPEPEPQAPEPDQPAVEPDLKIGQAEYTRSQQAFSALKTELGLARNASREDVLEAVRSGRGPQPAGDDGEADEDEDDPRVIAARERAQEAETRAFSAELRVQAAIYGQNFTDDSIELTNTLRTTDDPGEIINAIAAFRDKYPNALEAAGAGTGDEPPAVPGNPNAPPAPVGLSEGDAGPSARQAISVNAARRESGATQAIRGIFAGLGIATRPTDQP